MKHLTSAAAALALLVCPVRADYLEVRRDTVVRADHDKLSAELLDAKPPQLLALVPIPGTPTDQRDGYYEVLLPGTSQHGWIYRTFVRRFAGALPTNGQPVVTPTGPASAPLELHVIDVGQADANYIRCPDGTHQLLIDAGDIMYTGSAKAFRDYMTSHHAADDPIEVVVATHPHADHIGSMDWLITNYGIGLYLDAGQTSTTGTFGRVEAALLDTAVPRWSLADDALPDIDFCPRADVSARLIKPQGYPADSHPNNQSVIVRVDIGADSFLFVGDAEDDAEELLLNDPAARALLDCDFLKVGHHGSHTSTTPNFLAAVSPTICSVSCGDPGVSTNANHKHPRAETLDRLLAVCGPRQGVNLACPAYASDQGSWLTVNLNRAVYVTSVEGHLVFRSSGNGIQRITTH